METIYQYVANIYNYLSGNNSPDVVPNVGEVTEEVEDLEVEDNSWIQMKNMIPEGDTKFSNRKTQDAFYQIRSNRFILDMIIPDRGSDTVTIYVSDMIAKTVHRYSTTRLPIDRMVGGYFLSDTYLVIVESNERREAFVQHFIFVDHTLKELVPKASYLYARHMDNYLIIPSPLFINHEAYCVIHGRGILQFIPYLPRTNPCRPHKSLKNFIVNIEIFKLGNYKMHYEAFVYGSQVYFLILKEYLEGKSRFVVDKLACINVANCNTEKTLRLDENNHENVEIVNLKKMNFENAELGAFRFFNDGHIIVFTEEKIKDCNFPRYVVNLEQRTVTRVYGNGRDFGYPLQHEESLLLTRFNQRPTEILDDSGRRKKETVFEYKIIQYNVPRLSQICRDFMVSSDLTKDMTDMQMLFN